MSLIERSKIDWALVGGFLVIAIVLLAVYAFFDTRREAQAKAERLRREQADAETRLRRRQEQELERSERAAEEALLSLQKEANSIVVNVQGKASSLVGATRRAMEATHIVEQELEAGQIGGFWDAVEATAAELDQCRRILDEIRTYTLQYQQVGSRLQSGQLPAFDLGLAVFPDILEVERRLTQLRRRADRVEAFANAWGLRRIEKTLVAGFESLGQALSKLEGELKASLSGLETTLQSACATSATAIAVQTERLVSEMRAIREQHATETAMLRAAVSPPNTGSS